MVIKEHLQNLMSQGSLTVVELAACHVPEDSAPPPPPFRLGDMSWHARHSTSKDLVFQHTNFSALCYSSKA
jgi:hypothetical protein